jgi:Fe-S oxidoreductase
MERAHCPHHQVLAEASRLMIDGEPRNDRLEWLTGDLEVAETGDVMLFIGCSPLFDSLYADLGVRTLDSARSAIRLLNKAGITPVVRKDEVCCGHDLLWTGDLESFESLAKKTKAVIKESKAKLVLSACAECARTLSMDYEGLGVEVRHFTSWLAENKDKLGLGRPNGNGGEETTVTYQDPCRLGRHMRVFDAPRELIEDIPGVRLAEMDMSGRDAHCCGTAGFMYCDSDSRRMQAARLKEAEKTGAETLITACPKCLVHFNCARAEDIRRAGLNGDSPRGVEIKVEDITVLLDKALKKKASKKDSGTGDVALTGAKERADD